MGPDEAKRRFREDMISAALEAFLKAGGERNPARSMEAALTAVDFWGAAEKAAGHGGVWKPSTTAVAFAGLPPAELCVPLVRGEWPLVKGADGEAFGEDETD